MEPIYEETERLLPRTAFIILAAMLIASDVFILVCTQLDIGTQMWMFYIATAVFAAIVLLFYILKLRITVDGEKITLRYLKSTDIPLTDIIDYKIGDVDIIRNYSGWGFKNVKFKNYLCYEYERGISLKIMGKKVITFSTEDPEAIAALIPKNE